jgi:CheY-like chemotaxis protein
MNCFKVDRFVLPARSGNYDFQEAGLRLSGSDAYNEIQESMQLAEGNGKKENESQNKNLKILIAEDDMASEFLLKMIVKSFCSEIIVARTGAEAVEVCRNNQDIDLILMDIRMSNMNGYEATRQIRLFNKSVVIIAQTALAFIGDREKSIEAGCNDYIAKPISNTALIAMIKKYCDRGF